MICLVGGELIPSVTVTVERADKRELGRMLQLVLGCAVNCEDKHEYIRRIMNMEEAVQHDVMKAIQEVRRFYELSLIFLSLLSTSGNEAQMSPHVSIISNGSGHAVMQIVLLSLLVFCF